VGGVPLHAGRRKQCVNTMTKKNTKPLSRPAATPADPALADVPCAEVLAVLLTDDVGSGLAAMLAKVATAEHAYNSTPAIRDGFDHHEAEDGWASLLHYLEHAAAEVRRIVKAKR